MRIGIDGSCLANRRGFGRFARQTIAAIAAADSAHDFVVFVDAPSAPLVEIPPQFECVVVPVCEAPSRAAAASGRRRIADMLAMGRAVARRDLDLIYFPATYSFFPVWNVGQVVVTMHDTLALTRPELVFPSWRRRIAWTVKEHAAARWADCIVTVSETSRRDLLEWFRLPPSKVQVVTEGADSVFRPLPEGPESDARLLRYGVSPSWKYVLYVGGLSPHKNLPRLIDAFARVTSEAVHLVIVGDPGDVFHTHVPEIRAAIACWKLVDRVHLTGFVPDEDLVYFYNRAYVLSQPSLWEGFGLPPVEAMACGTPIVCSDAGSLPEIVGEAGLLFTPTDTSSIAATLDRILRDRSLRDRLAELGLDRAQRFAWATTARGLLECFEQLSQQRTARWSA